MSGCQEALLLTRQPTPAVPLQQAYVNAAQQCSPARSLSPHFSLWSSFLQGQTLSCPQEQTPVLLKERFPQELQYVSPALRRQSLQGKGNLRTVLSGQLVVDDIL